MTDYQYNTPKDIFYDDDEALWYTKIGLINKSDSLPLHYTVWGRTMEECRKRAKNLVIILRNQQSIDQATLI